MNRNLKLLIGCALLWLGLIAFGFVVASLRPFETGIASAILVLAGPSAVIMIAVISIATTISAATSGRGDDKR